MVLVFACATNTLGDGVVLHVADRESPATMRRSEMKAADSRRSSNFLRYLKAVPRGASLTARAFSDETLKCLHYLLYHFEQDGRDVDRAATMFLSTALRVRCSNRPMPIMAISPSSSCCRSIRSAWGLIVYMKTSSLRRPDQCPPKVNLKVPLRGNVRAGVGGIRRHQISAAWECTCQG